MSTRPFVNRFGLTSVHSAKVAGARVGAWDALFRSLARKSPRTVTDPIFRGLATGRPLVTYPPTSAGKQATAASLFSWIAANVARSQKVTPPLPLAHLGLAGGGSPLVVPPTALIPTGRFHGLGPSAVDMFRDPRLQPRPIAPAYAGKLGAVDQRRAATRGASKVAGKTAPTTNAPAGAPTTGPVKPSSLTGVIYAGLVVAALFILKR